MRREARALAALDHPNVVRLYDIDHQDWTHFTALEFVDMGNLEQLVHRAGPLVISVAIDYVKQAASGLRHLHEAGLVHRDIRPSHLLVDRRGRVKLSDTGLGRFSHDKWASLTVADGESMLGTADYFAPELAINGHSVDARADIYSLGCTLFFLLTGRPPFPHGTLPQRLMNHVSAPPPRIDDERPDAPPALVALGLKMMAKLPANRPQSATAVIEEIEAIA